MTQSSVESTVELWAQELQAVKERFRPLFSQERVALSAGYFLDGLLGMEPRKTAWMRAEAAGDPGPWRQQAILGRGRWDANALRDLVRDYALEDLADEQAVLVIDETGFLKKGQASCGVARQYTGSAGKVTNCQIGVFAAYASCHGHAFIDRALYLPREWTEQPERLRSTQVPESVCFMTKPELAQEMLQRAIASQTPFAWVAADAVYGVSHLEMTLRHAGKGYVLGVKSSHRVKNLSLYARADELAQGLPASAWKRCSAGEGVQGQRVHDWAYLKLMDQEASDYNPRSSGVWTRGLLIRRRLLDGELAYFSTWAPQGTSLETLAQVEGRRWSIEQSFEAAKGALGLDHNETRSWHGWHRHVSLVMLAFALLTRIRLQANRPIPKKRSTP